jgi:hypothetical protein
MQALFKFAVLAGIAAIIAGCAPRAEPVVVAPPPVQPEPVYNKF